MSRSTWGSTAPVRYSVIANLDCGHTASEGDLTLARADRMLDTMKLSAWCDRCGRFQPTKVAHIQPPLPG